jgi:hypothetical protein
MMNQMLIQMLVEAKYEGGARKFAEDFHIFITPEDEWIIALKDVELPPEFRQELGEFEEATGVKVIIAGHSNFEHMADEELEDLFSGDFAEQLQQFNGQFHLGVSRALVDLQVKGISAGSTEAKGVMDLFKSIEGVTNLRFQFEGDVILSVPLEGEEPEEVSTVEPKKLETCLQGRPDRETIINEDDQMNLKIALETAGSIDELLEML